MNLPPLRTGSCRIGSHWYPAVIGRTEGLATPELFVCGSHIDRFVKALPPAELGSFLRQGIELRADGGTL
jgi:hypothetical protein